MTGADTGLPRVVLMCHAEDSIDREGLAAWLASSFDLAGLVVIHEGRRAKLRRARREVRRVGFWRFLDVLAFRVYYRLRLARRDRTWIARTVEALRRRYPTAFDDVPRLDVVQVNTGEVERFLRSLQPVLLIARCKVILEPRIFDIASQGTFVLHPGICPEYRNAHGCFWALANRDLDRVGMTLLRVDAGIDTGPVYLQAACAFDELRESHVVIQYRAVLDNLEAVAATVRAVCHGAAEPLALNGRRSATWGQPWLSAHLKWKRAARAQWRRSCA
jgi:hypothetical protein